MLAIFSIAAVSLFASALAAPTGGIPVTKVAGPVKPNSYIVKLKENVPKDSHLSSVTSGFTASSSLQHSYGDVFHGYAVSLIGEDLDSLRHNQDIEYIVEDRILSLDYLPGDDSDISDANVYEAEPFTARAADGSGVDIYGIDTGIYTAHECFGGRARWGATFGGHKDADGNGHGTHTAGTAVGTAYGQATQAHVIAVKVLDDRGSGADSDIIAGVDYAYNSFKQSRRPSIATMSLGGSADTPLDTAVRNAISGGLHFTIAAGNANSDASSTSPAHVAAANTIGAVDSNNRKASFSNYGPIIDIQAPGVNIKSAWIGGPSAAKAISGTSMSTPYVAGVLAAAISKHGNKSPASLSAGLKRHGRAVCTGEPRRTTTRLATKW